MKGKKGNQIAWFITDVDDPHKREPRRIYWDRVSKDWYLTANHGTQFPTQAAAKKGDKEIGYKGIPPREIVKRFKSGLGWYSGSPVIGPAKKKDRRYTTVYFLKINDVRLSYWNHNFQEWTAHPDDATKYLDKHKADDVGKSLSEMTGYKVETVKAFDDGEAWNFEL